MISRHSLKINHRSSSEPPFECDPRPMNLKRIYKVVRRLRRKCIRAAWLGWMPIALGCDVVSHILSYLPISSAATSVASFLIVHLMCIAAALLFVEGAAAAAVVTDFLSLVVASLSAPAGESIASLKFEISSSLLGLCYNIFFLFLSLCMCIVLLLCVIARMVLACTVALPYISTCAIILLYVVFG